MRLKKQSMREVRDAGMTARKEQRKPIEVIGTDVKAYRTSVDELPAGLVEAISKARMDPKWDYLNALLAPDPNKPRYFRGALIKPKPETKTNGK